MDPNATLRRMRQLTAAIHAADDAADPHAAAEAATELAELFDALDKWLSRGGFRPSAWSASA